MAPQVPVQSSLRRWFWTAPLARVWSGPRSRWTVRASGSTASPSRPTTAERDLMESTARNPTSSSPLSFHFAPKIFNVFNTNCCQSGKSFLRLLPVVAVTPLSLLVFCFPPHVPSGPPYTFVWMTSTSSPPCSWSVATRPLSQKGVCLTESCVWRHWMPTAPRSTARFASMTSSLPMCPSLLTTTVRYVLSRSSKSTGVGLADLLIFVFLCYRNTIFPARRRIIFPFCCLHYLPCVESFSSISSSVFNS